MTNTTLPHWDMTTIYPSLDSAEFAAGFDSVVQAIADLEALYDQHGIALRDPAPLDEATVAAAEAVIERYNAVLKEFNTLSSYIHSFVSTDSRNTLAQARQSQLQQQWPRLSLLSTRGTAWIGTLDVEALIARSAVAQAHA